MNARLAWPLALGLLGALGCSDPVVTAAPTAGSLPPSEGAPTPAPVVATVGAAGSGASAASASPPLPKLEALEAEFSENERSRDPFRSFAQSFAQDRSTRVKSQREVILSQYALEELKLIGIVTRAEPAKAMLVDPTGKGFVVQRGQFVGRPDVVQAAGASGATYEINWRVDRIRPSDVVLIREDPQNPDVPSATRVIPLRPDESAEDKK